MDPLKDVAVLKNVVSDAVVRLRKAASIDTTLSGNIVVDGCSFPNLDVDVTGPPAGKALTVGRLKMITPTLLNSWANYDPSTYAPAAFTKTADGVVHIEGLVKDGTSDLVFILPVGYRPPTNTQFAQIANSAFARLEVQSDGHVRAYGSNANHWLTATFRV
jgi:hypothetical protein